MSVLTYPFAFSEDISNQVKGTLKLEEPLPYQDQTGRSGFLRTGTITLDGDTGLDIVLYHNEATAKFIYLRRAEVDAQLMAIIGMQEQDYEGREAMILPGQLCLGAARSYLTGEAITSMFAAPTLTPTFESHRQENMAIFPIAREGLKYQVAEGIFANYGYFCDEIILDAHHVFDSSVPVYNRTVELTIFKDKDLDAHQKENITVAFLADSIASGLVMKEVVARVKQRFDHLQQVEVIAPLATVRGLCRICQPLAEENLQVRVHVFETLLNALPPDYYYSAHFNIPEFHIRPDLEEEYQRWWGRDEHNEWIASTACAGYGWSEVFYSPRKQIQMMNGQLEMRHNLRIDEIIRRNLA